MMALALRMMWLWLQKTEPSKPWAQFNIHLPAKAQAMFSISVVTVVGDGHNTRFWTDLWLHGKAIGDLVPALMPFVRRKGWRSRSVAAAL